MIIFKYLTKEVFYTMIAVTMIAVFIFICNQFVRYLGYVANGKYAANMLFQLVLLQLPQLFSLLLPLGLFLGILLAYGRLYADSEMTVLMACGMSRRQLMGMTLAYSMIVFIIVGVLNLWAGPLIAQKRDQVMDMAETGSIMETIMPGRFQTASHGKRVFYIESLNHNRTHMRHIFMAQPVHANAKHAKKVPEWVVVAARRGYEQIDKKTGERYMVAFKGYRYQGMPGQRDFHITKFGTYGVRVDPQHISGRNEGVEVLPTSTLFKTAHKNPKQMAELQWRFSVPLSVIVLAFLAVPLSRVKPRQGRFMQLIPAIMLYIVYTNLLFVSRNWLKEGAVPAWIGMWWVHLVVLIFALWLQSRLSGWHVPLFFKRAKV